MVRMTTDVMAVDERLSRLEVTVAKGFAELIGRATPALDRCTTSTAAWTPRPAHGRPGMQMATEFESSISW